MAEPRRREFRMFAFDGLRGFGTAPEHVGRLAAGSVLLLASGTSYAPLLDAPGAESGAFLRRRTVQLVDDADVIGIPEAVAFRQDTVVVLVDADDRIPQGARVLVPANALASVIEAAVGSTGVTVPPAVPDGSGPVSPPEDAWWSRGSEDASAMPSWFKWGLVVVGVGLVGYVGWRTWKERG